MFTGLVERMGAVAQISQDGAGSAVLEIDVGPGEFDVATGDSVAINGVCLTVVSDAGRTLRFDVSSETLRLTSLGALKPSSSVNLERSLRVGDRMGGHFVTGHVDGLGTVIEAEDVGAYTKLQISLPQGMGDQVAHKGSVALDGVSLTINSVNHDAARGFSIELMIIPHTAKVTTLGSLKAGDRVNLETDVLAKYVVQAMAFKALKL